MDGVSRICFHDRFSGPSGIGISGRGRRSEGGATCSTCPRQVRIKRRIGNSLKFSWADTVGHACALCGCLVNYVELERPGCGVKTLREREREMRRWSRDLRRIYGEKTAYPKETASLQVCRFISRKTRQTERRARRGGAAERDANDAEAMQVKFLMLLVLFAQIHVLCESSFNTAGFVSLLHESLCNY